MRTTGFTQVSFEELDKRTPDELIVDEQDYELVTKLLAEVWTEGNEDRAPELGLVLLTNLRLDGYAASARERNAGDIEELEAAEPSPPPGQAKRTFTNLDVLLHDLRKRFAAAYGREPVVGKNRESMVGYPQHQAGALDPKPLDSGEQFTVQSGTAGRGVSIGVLDTPISPHSTLPKDRVHRDREFYPKNGKDHEPWVGHGTFVSGKIRAEAPGAQLDVLGTLSEEDGMATGWDTARAIAGFAGSGVRILNLSLGCVTYDDKPPLLMDRAVKKVTDGTGILVVTAAGNRAGEGFKYVWPGADDRVVAVGAHHANPELAKFSMQEPWVDCTAAGVDVPGPFPIGSVLTGDVSDDFDGRVKWTGTSFAAGTVSGKIAARMSERGVTAREALELLLDDPDSGVRPGFGAVSGS